MSDGLLLSWSLLLMQQTAARGAVGVAGGRGSEPLTPDNLSAGTPEDLGLNQTETE